MTTPTTPLSNHTLVGALILTLLLACFGSALLGATAGAQIGVRAAREEVPDAD